MKPTTEQLRTEAMRDIEPGDLIEDLSLHEVHAEKFLLATESRIDGTLELICGNGNRWRLPDHCLNLGNVVSAFRDMRKAANRTLPVTIFTP